MSYDHEIRQAYKGGFTYLKHGCESRDFDKGIVLDVNSLYPYVMHEKPMPYGEGKHFIGKYKEDKQYNLYIQTFTCRFKLKPNHIPTIQLKNNLSFVPTEYVESSGDEDVTLCLTNVDMELFFSHYDVDGEIDWIDGWKFRSSTKLFKVYIDKWIAIKIEADKKKNKGLRTLAKLMLNALYGKFGLNPNVRSKYPYLDADGIVRYMLGDKEKREPIYIPVAVFVTSWARYTTISAAQSEYDRFIYADTDSLHLIGLEEPKNINIHPTELGAWKHESTFLRARYIRAKSYIEDEVDNTFYLPDKELYGPTSLKITCAGMPKQCYKNVSWENFYENSVFDGKLMQRHVPGGIILKPTPFTIRK